jgi:hypothetical protein
MAEGKLKMNGRRLEDKIVPAFERIAVFAGEKVDIFDAIGAVIVPRDIKLELVDPKIVKTEEGPQLQFSNNAMSVWNDKVGNAALSVGVDSSDLYVTTGVAKIESLLAAQRSLDGEIDLMPRVAMTFKALGNDRQVAKVAYDISEDCKISVDKITASLDNTEIEALNFLRYGIGVALKSMRLSSGQINDFRAKSRNDAIVALDGYFESGARYLASHAFHSKDPEIRRRLNEAVRIEPPILELAASSAMNVVHLFNK